MRRSTKLALLVSLLLKSVASNSSSISSLDEEEGKCEEITIRMCSGIGYNFTRMPNQFNHDSQEEAGLEVHQFFPLVEIKCSSDLRFFLCSMYTPICLTGYKKPLPPCQSLCRRARQGCEGIMNQYGFNWPERMDCDKFPILEASSTNEQKFCLETELCNGENNSSTAKPLSSNKSLRPCRISKNSKKKRPKEIPITNLTLKKPTIGTQLYDLVVIPVPRIKSNDTNSVLHQNGTL